ncbi:hypothetical protein LAX75_00665 [Listeria cossartiae]|uniref:hypothetical protein n=1 Tax=Listeria cossartiae TaxID=2838249 RepID=UPI001E3A783F|nr:hypothetical protein [Listeria cossartiae]MCD2223186.1 hypothetical protein [Listeria cossartiae]MCD2237866.1 hypothetical protein [Listeria cossartiae]
MSELIKVFKYDDNGVFERDDLIILKKGEKIPAGYTLIEPPVPSINPVFNVKKQKWSSGEEASISELPQLTELEKLTQDYADLMLYVAEVEKKTEQTQQDNANLLLSLAEAGVL